MPSVSRRPGISRLFADYHKILGSGETDIWACGPLSVFAGGPGVWGALSYQSPEL